MVRLRIAARAAILFVLCSNKHPVVSITGNRPLNPAVLLCSSPLDLLCGTHCYCSLQLHFPWFSYLTAIVARKEGSPLLFLSIWYSKQGPSGTQSTYHTKHSIPTNSSAPDSNFKSTSPLLPLPPPQRNYGTYLCHQPLPLPSVTRLLKLTSRRRLSHFFWPSTPTSINPP